MADSCGFGDSAQLEGEAMWFSGMVAAAAAATTAALSCQANPVGVVLENAPGNLASSVFPQPFKESVNQLIAYNKSFFRQQGWNLWSAQASPGTHRTLEKKARKDADHWSEHSQDQLLPLSELDL